MKKFLFVVVAMLCTASMASAQYRPEKLGFSTEVHYTPVTDGNSNVNKLGLPDYGVKVRMHLNENVSARLNLGLNTTSAKSTQTVTIGSDEYNDLDKESRLNFSIAPGIEYTFVKFERVFPYVGAEIGFSAGSNKDKRWNSKNSDYNLTKRPVSGFRFGALAGVDVYLCEGLYAGLELGLGYDVEKVGKGSVTTSAGGQETTTNGTLVNSKGTFGLYAVPSIRIGWHF